MIFIDVDGTLVTKGEKVPISAVKAIQTARKKGHKVYLCTGRSKPEIYAPILAIGFDGIIGAGGGFVESEGKMIYHKQMQAKEVRHMVDFFQAHQIDFYLESNGGLFASENLRLRLEEMLFGKNAQMLPASEKTHPFIDALLFGEKDLYKEEINKACFLESQTVSFERIKQEFAAEFEVIQCTVPAFGKESGELLVPGIHKAVAIEALLQHLDRSSVGTIAIGDGLNDIEMFQFCEVGIAMGNGQPELKRLANYVTSSVEEDGIYHAFKKYQLV